MYQSYCDLLKSVQHGWRDAGLSVQPVMNDLSDDRWHDFNCSPSRVTLNTCTQKGLQHVFISQINQVTLKTNISLWKCILKSSYCVLWTQIMRGLQSPITKGLCDKSMNSTKCFHGYLANVCIILQLTVYVFPFFSISFFPRLKFKLKKKKQPKYKNMLLKWQWNLWANISKGVPSGVRSAEGNNMCLLK